MALSLAKITLDIIMHVTIKTPDRTCRKLWKIHYVQNDFICKTENINWEHITDRSTLYYSHHVTCTSTDATHRQRAHNYKILWMSPESVYCKVVNLIAVKPACVHLHDYTYRMHQQIQVYSEVLYFCSFWSRKEIKTWW